MNDIADLSSYFHVTLSRPKITGGHNVPYSTQALRHLEVYLHSAVGFEPRPQRPGPSAQSSRVSLVRCQYTSAQDPLYYSNRAVRCSEMRYVRAAPSVKGNR